VYQGTKTARRAQAEALLRAAREGNAHTVKASLSAPDADVNAMDERGSTPLYRC
jgi:ankyrin repeat protein